MVVEVPVLAEVADEMLVVVLPVRLLDLASFGPSSVVAGCWGAKRVIKRRIHQGTPEFVSMLVSFVTVCFILGVYVYACSFAWLDSVSEF